jgi:hypothetical protein
MNQNMGSLDRIIRVVMANIFTVLYLSGTVTGTFCIILLILGGVFLVTSLISFCPLYVPLKLSTRKE